MAISLFLLFSTYLLLPLALLKIFERVFKDKSPEYFFIVFGLTPIVIVRLLLWGMQLFPGMDVATIQLVYIGLTLPILLFLLGNKWEPPIGRLGDAFWILLVGALCGWLMHFPLTANDPLKYSILARLFFRDMSIGNYPMTEADPETGFFVVSAHPPFFPGFILWNYIVQGTSDFFGVSRLINSYYLLLLSGLVAQLTGPRSRCASMLAVLSLVFTPGLLYSASIHHLDVPRIFCIFISLLSFIRYLERRTSGWMVLSVSAVAAAIFSHSSGLVILAVLPLVALWHGRRHRCTYAVKEVLFIAVAAVIIGGGQYIQNILQIGAPVRDSFNLSPELAEKYNAYIKSTFGITDFYSRIAHGVFRGFCELQNYGLLFWGALLVVLFRAKHNAKENFFYGACIFILVYFSASTITTILGYDFFINSYRYSLVLVPMLAYIVGTCSNSILTILLSTVVVLWGVTESARQFSAVWPGLRQVAKLSWQDEEKSSSLLSYDEFRIVESAKSIIGKGERTLVVRPMEFAYYTRYPIVRHTDPSLMSLYGEKDPRRFISKLEALQIRYLLLSESDDPLLSDTCLAQISQDDKFTTELSKSGPYRLLKLKVP